MLLILAILSSPLALILAAIAFGIYGARMPKHSPTGNDFALAMSIVSVIASGSLAVLWRIRLRFLESPPFTSGNIPDPRLLALFAIAALTVAWRQLDIGRRC